MPDSLLDSIRMPVNRRTRPRREADVQNERLIAVLEHLPDGVLCLSQDWAVTYANDRAMQISRLQPEDIGSRTFWELFPGISGTELDLQCREVMATRQPRHVQHYSIAFLHWIEAHIFPLDEGIALHYRDITALKEAEMTREDATRQMEKIFSAAADSIVCIDREWNCTYANAAAHDLLKADKLVGENLWDSFAVNHEEPFRSNYLKTMNERVATEFDAYVPAPIDLWFRLHARPYDDGMVIFASDITDRKGAELLRDASVEKLRQVLEITSDAVMTVDRRWTCTFLNRRAREILSAKGDVLGKNIWQTCPENMGTELETVYRRAMNEGISGELESYYSSWLKVWVALQCRPFEDGIVIFFRDVTERHEAELALSRQHELLASIQQTARVATFEMELASGKITFGPGSYTVFGYPLGTITDYAGFEQILLPEYREQVREAIRLSIESGEMVVRDFQVMAADGRPLWIEARAETMVVDGMPVSLSGMVIDIEDRKRNEEALAASEARYRVLADLNPQALWMCSAAGELTYTNQGFLDYVGYKIEELDRDTLLKVFYAEDFERFAAAWMQAWEAGCEFEAETRIVRGSDGQARWWSVRGKPVRDENGRVLHWLGVATDIHDSKLQAEMLQVRQLETERQKAELESIYQAAPVGLALFDAKTLQYLRINDRQVEIVGLPREEILGRAITDLVPLMGLKDLLMAAARGEHVRNHVLEGELPARPGEHRFWNVSYSPVYGAGGVAGGDVEAIAAVVVEITHVKKAEAALLQNEKLAAVGRLASSISHEINNPLEAITNLLYLISLSDELPEGLRHYVTTAQSELSRVCQIATQTLRFHKQAIKAARVSAAELVQPVLRLYQGRLANSSIEVAERYASSGTVVCFENDIRQVLNNLIANAIDAMRQGGRMEIRAHDAVERREGSPARRGLRITIADTGHGMPEAVKRRAFEPFYTTKDLNGTGLGLWISEGILARHKGRISFRSVQGMERHGTVFTVFLPANDDPVSTLHEAQG